MLNLQTAPNKFLRKLEIQIWQIIVGLLKKSTAVRKTAKSLYVFVQSYSLKELILISVLTILAGLISGFMLSYLTALL